MYTPRSYLLIETINEKSGFLLQNANTKPIKIAKWIIEFALIVHIYSGIIFDFNGQNVCIENGNIYKHTLDSFSRIHLIDDYGVWHCVHIFFFEYFLLSTYIRIHFCI